MARLLKLAERLCQNSLVVCETRCCVKNDRMQ